MIIFPSAELELKTSETVTPNQLPTGHLANQRINYSWCLQLKKEKANSKNKQANKRPYQNSWPEGA